MQNHPFSETKDLKTLISTISEISKEPDKHSIETLHQATLLRNWLIGYLLVAYKTKGIGQEKHGIYLIENLSISLQNRKIETSFLKNLEQFYLCYPQLESFFNVEYAEPKSWLMTPAKVLLENLSFSHFVELLRITDPYVRYFYECECILGNWSVNQLRRQILSERHLHPSIKSECPKNPEREMRKLFEIRESRKPALLKDDPYVAEYLDDWKAGKYFSEKKHHYKLLEQLKNYLLDIDKHYGYSTTQKELTIDGKGYVADLVFYNVPLHHMMIYMVKNHGFRQKDLEKLKAIVSHYHTEMYSHEIPPIGILICTPKEKRTIKYVIAGADLPIETSVYRQNLPTERELSEFLENTLD